MVVWGDAAAYVARSLVPMCDAHACGALPAPERAGAARLDSVTPGVREQVDENLGGSSNSLLLSPKPSTFNLKL